MCGLVGVVTLDKLKLAHKSFFWQGLYSDALRGMHSTGIFFKETKEQEADLFKKAMNASDFLGLKAVDNIMFDYDKYDFMIGHNRHATKGSITHPNAHPFQHDHITLVHNGTVSLYGTSMPGTFDTDSETIAHSMSVLGEKETIEDLDGAYALIWHNSDNNTINFARNDERPLNFGITEDESTLLIASESGMLEWLAKRNNIKLSAQYFLGVGDWISIDLDNHTKITDWTSQKFEVYEETYWNKAYGHGNYSGNVKSLTGKKSERATKTDDLLKELGLSLGEEVEFYPFEFNAYSSSDQGTSSLGSVTGISVNDPFFDITVYSVLEKDVDYNATYRGKVLSARLVKGAVDIVLNDITEVVSPKRGDRVDLSTRFQYLNGPSNIALSVKEWNKMTKDGCITCGDKLKMQDHEKIIWMDGGQPMCPSCVEEWDKATYKGLN